MIGGVQKTGIAPTVAACILGVLLLVVAGAVFGMFWCPLAGSFSNCPLDSASYLVRGALIAAGVLALGIGVGLALPDLLLRRRARRFASESPPGPALGPVSIPVARRAWLLVICVGVALALLVAMAVTPVPQSFTLHSVAIYDLQFDCPGVMIPSGSSVSFHWSAGGPTAFFVVGCSANREYYVGNGTSGSGSFVSTGGVYEFGSGCPGPSPCYPADVTGTYTGPLIPF